MNKVLALLVFVGLGIGSLYSQASIRSFGNLVGGTWSATGNWVDGTPFLQKVSYTNELNNTIIESTTIGNVAEEGTELGVRNRGIRYLDPESGELLFMEFDVFGGVTKGTCTFEGNNLFYTYDYDEMTLTDAWIYVEKDMYQFVVGVMTDGKFDQIFLQTKFTRD